MSLGIKQNTSLVNRIFRFYYNGFSNMPGWGKRAWVIILIKLFIMFAVLKIFFFHDFLQTNWPTDKQRTEHVLDQLTKPSDNHARQH